MAEVQQVIGKTLGSYRIVDVLGEGGMGMVYAAQHPLIGRRAAIKVLLPELSNNKEVVERFFNEARAATMIKHPGIIDIFDFGYADEGGSAYIVMEHLDGEVLTERIDRLIRLPEFDIFRFTRQAASALAAAHRAGIIHRDLKPDNIFVVPDGEVAGGERIKILDFGIAKLSPDATGAVSKTRTGAVMGSPLYMSPEQCRGAGDADARADVYAAGCVMYHMAVGQPPFDGRGAGEVIAKHIYEQPVPPRAIVGTLSEALDAIVLQCLAKDPEHRFNSMRALIKAIDSATGGQFATRSHKPNYQTPPLGVPVVTADKLAATMPPSAHHPSAAFRAQSQPYGAQSATPQPAQVPFRTPVPKSTTISGAAAQVTMDGLDRPPRSKGPLVAVLGLVVAAALGVTIYVVMNSGGDDVKTTAAATVEPPKSNGVDESSSGDDDPQNNETEIGEPGAGGVKAPPPVEKVKIEITSTPKGALVRGEERKLLGETPFSIEVDKSSEERVFHVSQFGFEPTEVKLVPDQDRTENVVLERPEVASKSRDRKAKKKSSRKPVTRSVPTVDPLDQLNKKKKKRKTGFGQTVDPLGD